MSQQIITENSLSMMNDNMVIKNKLRVDGPTIFLIIPDSNINLIKFLPHLNFYLSQATAIISPSQIFTIGNKMYNGKKQYLKLKQDMNQENESRKLKVNSALPQLSKLTEKDKLFYLYDLTLLSNAYDFAVEKYNNKKAATILFTELEKLYKYIAAKNENINIVPIFIIENKDI